jgi:hypothetical protein
MLTRILASAGALARLQGERAHPSTPISDERVLAACRNNVDGSLGNWGGSRKSSPSWVRRPISWHVVELLEAGRESKLQHHAPFEGNR